MSGRLIIRDVVILTDVTKISRTHLTLCSCPEDALALDSERSGTKLVKNLAKCRRSPTALRTTTQYQALCTGINSVKIDRLIMAVDDGKAISYNIIVNGITNFCFWFLHKPYTEASARPKTKFLMSFTIGMEIFENIVKMQFAAVISRMIDHR